MVCGRSSWYFELSRSLTKTPLPTSRSQPPNYLTQQHPQITLCIPHNLTPHIESSRATFRQLQQRLRDSPHSDRGWTATKTNYLILLYVLDCQARTGTSAKKLRMFYFPPTWVRLIYAQSRLEVNRKPRLHLQSSRCGRTNHKRTNAISSYPFSTTTS